MPPERFRPPDTSSFVGTSRRPSPKVAAEAQERQVRRGTAKARRWAKARNPTGRRGHDGTSLIALHVRFALSRAFALSQFLPPGAFTASHFAAAIDAPGGSP